MNKKTIAVTLSLIGLIVATALMVRAVVSQSLETLAINSLVAWILLSLCLMLAYKIYYGAKNEN